MSLQEYFDEMATIHELILILIENENDIQENFQKLIKLLDDSKIRENKYKLKSLLYLLIKIVDNHYRYSSFFSQIEQIIIFFKSDIQKYFSNSEVFNVFKTNKKILLFLIEEKIIVIDQYIIKEFLSKKNIKAKYPQYFYPEIEPFLKDKTKISFDDNEEDQDDDDDDENIHHRSTIEIKEHAESDKNSDALELPNDFYQNRKIGANEKQICELIRNDSIEDFIVYIHKNNIVLESAIKPSIYETNSFLYENRQITLIEYAAFYESIQIFQYLIQNEVELTPSLWKFAIHSNNAELMQILEENKVDPVDSNIIDCFIESIKCHHNEVASYIESNLITDKLAIDSLRYLEYFNFVFVQNQNIIKDITLYDLCKYSYYYAAEILLNSEGIDVNATKTTIYFFVFFFNKVPTSILI